MKKLLLALMAFLLLGGVSFAANIPNVVDPDDGSPSEVWITPVYNNSGGTLDVGDVVVWDMEQSTGDDDNWVTTTTTAATSLVAGVVYPRDIVSADIGTIAIRGPVAVDAAGSLNSVDGPACTSTTAGS